MSKQLAERLEALESLRDWIDEMRDEGHPDNYRKRTPWLEVVNSEIEALRSLSTEGARGATLDVREYVAAAEAVLKTPPNPANIVTKRKDETGYNVYEAWARRCATAILAIAAAPAESDRKAEPELPREPGYNDTAFVPRGSVNDPVPSDTYWMIERNQRHKAMPPSESVMWFKERLCFAGGDKDVWTPHSDKARHFESKAEAEAYSTEFLAGENYDPRPEVTEHMDHCGPTPAAERKAEPVALGRIHMGRYICIGIKDLAESQPQWVQDEWNAKSHFLYAAPPRMGAT